MITRLLSREMVVTGLQGKTKPEIISALLDVICKGGKVKDRDQAYRDLLNRENEISTGMENGIAIPHAKTDAVDEVVACVGVSKKKVTFDSLDGKPSRIFIMALSPRDAVGPHIAFLGEVGRLLNDEQMRKKITNAKTSQDLFVMLTSKNHQ